MCNILWNEKSVQKVHTVHKTLLLLEVSWEYTTLTTSDFLLHYVQSADFFIMCNILWNEKSVQKVHTVHRTLLLLEVSWEYTTSTLLTSCCIMYNLLWKEKLAQNFTLCPKLYFPYHHLYTNIQISKCQHHCYHCQWLHFKLRFLWSWCLPQFLHKKFTLCPKLYFPYHHLYTNIQNVNIIAIIASDFTSNFGFCGLGAYHSFCTKNSQTLLSISSFVHKYPNVNIIAIIASDFTSNFGFCGLGAYHSFCIVNFVYPGSCYLHTIIMHKTVIVSVIKAITVLCKCNSAQDSTLHTKKEGTCEWNMPIMFEPFQWLNTYGH